MSSDFNLYQDEGFFGLPPETGPLKQRFTMPPFSTWNTRDADWMQRRRKWLARGIKSEEGRDNVTYNVRHMEEYHGASAGKLTGTSIFDPVVCELAYGWWCPPGGIVLDPFAGGSVRGIIASLLGYKYLGIELRDEQVQANRAQVGTATRGPFAPKWRTGDAYELVPTAPRCDFIFSCPPYGNLEVYSKDPADISNMSYDMFLARYAVIISRSLDRLRDDRFACFVVANFRSRDNNNKQMVDFVGDTIYAFETAGAMLYNDIVLINSIGTGASRANTNFVRGARKVVKLHQNVLVFVKGDPKKAAAYIPLDSGVCTGAGGQEGG